MFVLIVCVCAFIQSSQDMHVRGIHDQINQCHETVASMSEWFCICPTCPFVRAWRRRLWGVWCISPEYECMTRHGMRPRKDSDVCIGQGVSWRIAAHYCALTATVVVKRRVVTKEHSSFVDSIDTKFGYVILRRRSTSKALTWCLILISTSHDGPSYHENVQRINHPIAPGRPSIMWVWPVDYG